MGNQAGGWTITWQGYTTKPGFPIIPGTTILDGIREHARGDVIHSADRFRAGPGGRRRASWSSARRRTARASATSAVRAGASTPPTRACCARRRTCSCPPRTRRPSTRSARRRAAARCVVVSGRPLIIDPARLGAIDALVAGLAAGQRGRRRRGHAVRPPPLHRHAAGQLAADARAGADQRRRCRLRPALPVRYGLRTHGGGSTATAATRSRPARAGARTTARR